MIAHPNAHILAQLAEIAKTNNKPWERLEMKNMTDDWVECGSYTALLHPNITFRIKPTTVNIGGMELEGPLREAPEKGTKLWLLFDHTLASDMPVSFSPQMPEHAWWLNQGRFFGSKEARDKYQDALVKLANGETN